MRRGENTCRLEFDSPSASPGSAGRVGGRERTRLGSAGGGRAGGHPGEKDLLSLYFFLFLFLFLFLVPTRSRRGEREARESPCALSAAFQ